MVSTRVRRVRGDVWRLGYLRRSDGRTRVDVDGRSRAFGDPRYDEEVGLYDEAFGPLPIATRATVDEWADPTGDLASRYGDLPRLAAEAAEIVELKELRRAERRARSDAKRAAKAARSLMVDAVLASVAADLLGVARPTFYGWIERGEIHAIRVGGRLYVLTSTIDELRSHGLAS